MRQNTEKVYAMSMRHSIKQVDQAARPAVSADTILLLFDNLGMRNTRPRRLIAEGLAALASSGTDFAVHDLWRELLELDPSIGRATVYRAVDVLVEQGLLDRIPMASGTHRYRLCGASHHHHVRCNRCELVVEVDACLPPEVFAAVATATNFAIDGHSLELFGRCAMCREEQ